MGWLFYTLVFPPECNIFENQLNVPLSNIILCFGAVLYEQINVALSPPEAYSGGDLLALSDESLLEVSERSEGNAVVHWGSVCHAVSPVTEGTRYAMVIFLDNAVSYSIK